MRHPHVTPVLISDQRHHADCEDGSECWLEGKDDRAGHNDRTASSRTNRVRRSRRARASSTGGDRVHHAAGNAEEPTIQFSTDFLIRLQQPQGADAMSTTATAEADRQEVDPPIRVETVTWSQAGQLDWW